MTTESRLISMETQVQDLVEVCKEIKERLKKSNSNIRKDDPEDKRNKILKRRAI